MATVRMLTQTELVESEFSNLDGLRVSYMTRQNGSWSLIFKPINTKEDFELLLELLRLPQTKLESAETRRLI